MSQYGVIDFIYDVICEIEPACDALGIIGTVLSLISTYATEIFVILFAVMMIISAITLYFYLDQPNEREGRDKKFNR